MSAKAVKMEVDYDSYEEDILKPTVRNNDEETDDASETEKNKIEEESVEIKEQMYRVKLAQIKKQLAQLKDGTLHEYSRRLKKLQGTQKERQKQISVWQSYLLNLVEQEYQKDKQTSLDEFKLKKIELKENLIVELQEKQRSLESERVNTELTGGCLSQSEGKTHVTRKLRRRPNDPVPASNDKRRKPSPTQINYLLDESEIDEDLALVNKGRPTPPSVDDSCVTNLQTDVRIESGKLFFNKKWFHRCQPIYAHHHRDNTMIRAIITSINDKEIWIKKMSDGTKIRIVLAQLIKGKYTISKRALQ